MVSTVYPHSAVRAPSESKVQWVMPLCCAVGEGQGQGLCSSSQKSLSSHCSALVHAAILVLSLLSVPLSGAYTATDEKNLVTAEHLEVMDLDYRFQG